MIRHGNLAGLPPMGLKGGGTVRTTPDAPLRRAARDQVCTLRIQGACLPGNETVVGCHVRFPGFCGAAQKPHDIFIIDACAGCHAVQEDRSRWAEFSFGWADVLRGLMETQLRRIDAGLITIGKQP